MFFFVFLLVIEKHNATNSSYLLGIRFNGYTTSTYTHTSKYEEMFEIIIYMASNGYP